MKILILTDSLGLPRYKPELCTFDETWPILIKNKYPNILQVSIGAATSQVLLKQVNYQKAFEPDIVILQVGIVDCAPRFMTRKELDFTYALGTVGKGLRFLLNRQWIKRLRKISYTNEVQFKENINKIQNSFNCPVIAIEILPSSEQYEASLPGITAKISAYNELLEQTFKQYIHTDDFIFAKGIMSDNHHLNKIGHNYLYQKIEAILKKSWKQPQD
jgi:hypothetical protein